MSMLSWIGLKTDEAETANPNRSSSLAGHLWKLKRNQHSYVLIPQWNKRWFSIERHLLKWYSRAATEKASGVVDLRFVTDIAPFESGGGVYSFVLSYPDRNLLLRAVSQGEMEKWMRALQYQADIVRGGDGTHIVTDTNSFCLSPQGKGRAIKGKYRPATLEATVEAAMNRLQVLESEVSKTHPRAPIRARGMLEQQSSYREHLRPEDVNLSEGANSKKASPYDSRLPSESDLRSVASRNDVTVRSVNSRSELSGRLAGSGSDGAETTTTKAVFTEREVSNIDNDDTGERRNQQRRVQTVSNEAVRDRDQRPPVATRVRERKHSIESDVQSIEEIHDLPVPRIRVAKSRSRGDLDTPDRSRIDHLRSAANKDYSQIVDTDEDESGYTTKPPSSWGYDDVDTYKRSGERNVYEGRVSTKQAEVLRAVASAKVSSKSAARSSSVSTTHALAPTSANSSSSRKQQPQQRISEPNFVCEEFDDDVQEVDLLPETASTRRSTKSMQQQQQRQREGGREEMREGVVAGRDRDRDRDSKESSVRSKGSNGGWFA